MTLSPQQEQALEALREVLRQATWHQEEVRVRQDDLRALVMAVMQEVEHGN